MLYKEDLEKNYKNIKVNDIFLLVNNYCNATCDYCIMGLNTYLGTPDYGNNNVKKEEMSKDTFDEIIKKIKKQGNIGGISLSGKEPLIWSNLGYALDKLEKNNISVEILSNGINTNVKLKKNNILILHLDKKYIGINYELWYKKSLIEGFKLGFACIISTETTIKDLEYYINIILKYGSVYYLSPQVPTGFGIGGKIAIAKMLFLFRKLYENGNREYNFFHPIANCMIKKNDLAFLYKNKIHFSGKCEIGEKLCIDYNGKDYYPCPGFPRKKEIGKNDLNDLGRDIFKYASDLRLNHPPKEECYTCGMYKNGQCQGGCLIERVL